MLEQYAFPGELIIGTDSHTPNAGGLGACAVGVGGADAVEVIAGSALGGALSEAHRRLPDRRAERLDRAQGRHPLRRRPADRRRAATNAIVEYIGPGARTISATGKATITNMGAELGATTSIFPADERMARYLRATGRGGAGAADASRTSTCSSPTRRSRPNPENYYDRVVELDLSTLEPLRRRAALARSGAPDLAARRRGRGPEERFRRRRSRPR